VEEGGLVGIRRGDRVSLEILELGDGYGERTYVSIPQWVTVLGAAQSQINRNPYPRLGRGKRPLNATFNT
jgi:hypothetical protein